MAKPDSQAGLSRGHKGELAQFIDLCREETRESFREGAAQREELHEAFALLLGYGCAIEKLLAQTAGGGGSLPDHISLRAYVQQLLSGEAQRSSVQRLERYFTDAFRLFSETHLGVEKALQRLAENVAEKLKPARIEARVKVPKFFGGGLERACWEEFKKEWHSLDGAAVRKIGRPGGLTVRIEIPQHEVTDALLQDLRRYCVERRLRMEDPE